MEQIALFFNDIIFFFTEEIPFMLQDFLDYINLAIEYGLLNFLQYTMQIAYDVAAEVIGTLDISNQMSNAYNALDSNTLKIAGFFKIPEFIAILMSAYAAKFVLRLVL